MLVVILREPPTLFIYTLFYVSQLAAASAMADQRRQADEFSSCLMA